MGDDVTIIRERFIEQMGLIYQADGLPRIAGRLVGLLIFDGCAYSFTDLGIKLQVSRGSVSTNARLLEQLGVIDRMAKPGDRQDYFVLADDPGANVLKGVIARASKARETVHKTADALPARGHADVKRRIGQLEDFYTTLVDTFGEVTERKR